jgi:hypothetical protein
MNSTNNDFYKNAALKVFAQLGQLIEEDEKETENKIDNNKKDDKNVKSNKKDNKNVKSNKKDNKIVKSNKIDDKNVISNEIKELTDEEQIINGKTIEFGTFIKTDIVVPLNTKEDIKDYIFGYINRDFQEIEKICKKRKVKLSNDDMLKCYLILFKRCKILFDLNKVYYNKDVYNMDDDEEKDIFEEYLKVNKSTTEI